MLFVTHSICNTVLKIFFCLVFVQICQSKARLSFTLNVHLFTYWETFTVPASFFLINEIQLSWITCYVTRSQCSKLKCCLSSYLKPRYIYIKLLAKLAYIQFVVNCSFLLILGTFAGPGFRFRVPLWAQDGPTCKNQKKCATHQSSEVRSFGKYRSPPVFKQWSCFLAQNDQKYS